MGHTLVARVVGHALPGRADGRASSGLDARRSARRSRSSTACITGRTAGPPLWGRRQGRRGPRARPRARDSTSTASFAYSNGDEDIPFLERRRQPGRRRARGRPARARREQRGWPILRCESRGGTPGHRRTSRAPPASTAAWPTAARRRARARAPEPLARHAAWRSPAASAPTSGSRSPASTSTSIRGEEHLWSARPVRLRLQPPEQARPDHR